MNFLDPRSQIGFDTDDDSCLKSTHSYQKRKHHPSVSRSHDTRRVPRRSGTAWSFGGFPLPGLIIKGDENKRNWAEISKLDMPNLLASGLGLRVEHRQKRRSLKGMPGIKPLVYEASE